MRSLNSRQVGAARISEASPASRRGLQLGAVDDQMHHRRLEEEAALDDLEEARHRGVRCHAGLIHLLEDAVGILGEKRAAADAPADQALALHHRQGAAHRRAAGLELAGEVAPLGSLAPGRRRPSWMLFRSER